MKAVVVNAEKIKKQPGTIKRFHARVAARHEIYP